jgi:acetoin utilization protein AcuC
VTIGILYQEELKQYDFGPGHPFRGDRYIAFYKFLRENLPPNETYKILEAEPANEEDLLLICHQTYIEFTEQYYRAAHMGLTYPGDFTLFHSADNMPTGTPGKIEEAARLVVGQAKKACDLVQAGEFKKVISVGGGLHHAKRSYGEGFCLYNDVAFSALHLMQNYGLERILILDTDAHAGNGTAAYFYEEPKVLFIDIHQDPRTIYPGTGFADQIGAGDGRGFTINIPMPIDAGNDAYELAFDSIVTPITQEFKPQVIIRNGGSDPHFNDGLTQLGLTVSGFKMIGERVRELTKICDDKLIDLIASGYNERILPYAWLALISGLTGIDIELEEPEPIPQAYRADHAFYKAEKVIEEVKLCLKQYWEYLS